MEAPRRSFFLAGARPFILWICGLSLALFFVPQYLIAAAVWLKIIAASGWTQIPPYPVDAEGLLELTLMVLGLGGLRSVEKWRGLTK